MNTSLRLRDFIVLVKYSFGMYERFYFNESVLLQADYSPAAHDADLSNFMSSRREGHKRARALLDFARQDEDELGFRWLLYFVSRLKMTLHRILRIFLKRVKGSLIPTSLEHIVKIY